MATTISQSSSTQGLHKLEDQITCPVCLEHYTNPKLLPCCHSLCLHCLQHLPTVNVEGNHSIDCPTCRSPCPVPDNNGLASLPPSFVINNLMEVYDLMKRVSDHQHVSCGNCDNSNADRYCKQCAKFLCTQCLHFHDNWKPNSGHETLSLDEVANTAYQLPQAKPDPSMSCTDHNKPLDIFCESCQQLICHNCTLRKHRDHNYDLVTDTYQQHKDIIVQSSLQPLHQQHDRLKEAKQILINRRNEISQQTEGTKEEIHHTIAEIKNRLDETERKLKDEVELASSIKLRVLDHQVKEIDSVLGQVTECMDYVDQCIKVGSPQQVILTKPQMMSRTQSVITSVKEKTFEPLEQPDIQLIKNNSIHQIHNIGKVEYTIPSLTKVNDLPYRHIPLINQPSTVTISLNTVDDPLIIPVPSSLIKCHLTPPDNTPLIQCLVRESSQSGQYNVLFTPHTRGLHQLYITIGYSTIPGTPVSVPVTVPPEMRGTAVKTITGLNGPSGVAVTDDGLMVVSETEGNRITILDREGKKVRSFGSKGTKRGHFRYPQGVAITLRRGTILVVDRGNDRIQEFTLEGDYINRFGCRGKGPLQFNYPHGITINKTTGQVFIADTGNNRIQVLHPDLTFSHMIGSKGSGQGRFDHPHDMTTDSQGFMYVTDWDNHCIQKFTTMGQFVSSHGTKGSQPGQLKYPSGITIDDNDLLYVNNDENGYVIVYTTDGEYVCSIDNEHDFEDNEFLYGIAINRYGDLLVCCPVDNLVKEL